ncbi:MAG: SIR2 family protein [Anaerolineaceae bacterium]|nr:SIR2 family protein [Anaerolineaceae bacterium]
MVDLPLPLRHSLETGECVLFIGAGVGFNLLTPNGEYAPVARDLAVDMAEKFNISIDESDLSKVSTIVELRHGRKELEVYLRQQLADLEPDEAFRWLFSRRWRAIFTTNYDNAIQRAYTLVSEPPQIPITISLTSDLVQVDSRFEVPIYHLHGTLFGNAQPQIVITDDDYARFREPRRMLFNLLKNEFATSTILYIGYSNSDPNWNMVLAEMRDEFLPSPMPRAYRISPDTSAVDKEILAAKGIETIDATLTKFHQSAVLNLADTDVDYGKLQEIRRDIPTALLEAFDKNPAPVSRLISSWTYVNQAPFHLPVNLDSFLDGDRPNWSLLASNLVFERDLEEEVYEHLLDYATRQTTSTSTKTILGPAGYGITTLLMRLSVRLIQDRVGPVFMLKPSQELNEGDIEFACSLFEERPFFVIDDAADFVTSINSVTDRLNNLNKPAMFLMGSRTNEWRQRGRTPRGTEFQIEPLSDLEIRRLIPYLDNHAKNNALRELPFDQQFAVIKNKHNKELLVTMKEATEGKNFDAIIEDEFWGIKDELARNAYLMVCCFYQHGVQIRPELLAELSDVNLVILYEKLSIAADGVVVIDDVDASRGIYLARSRHRIIARIVWERCGNLSERENILHTAVQALNFNYGVDQKAFEAFVRADTIIDDIATLDGRTRFFDYACRKDPQSPYVRQHYARMLLRADKPVLALGQIDAAINLAPRTRVLYHTKAEIEKNLAISTPSERFARNYMIQSEANYEVALNMYPGDEYSYQGLADLYFRWAQRSTSDAEQTEYLAKAERTITDGLRKANHRDGLWIVSAEIQKWLGDEPSRLQALERAVSESPQSTVARYLLGRAYRTQGNYERAINILEPVVRQHFDAYRTFVEYAVAMIHVGQTYKQAIAMLELCRTFGMRDPRYVATLGGMMFLNGDFTSAEEVFREGQQRFEQQEYRTVQFTPPNPENVDQPYRIRGRVVTIAKGYCFIEVPEYPNIFCPYTKFRNIVISQGVSLDFQLVFTARGAIADDLKSLEDKTSI